MLQRLPSLDDLPYEHVIDLIRYKEYVDSVNHIAKRTRLLAEHPELFDKVLVQQIKTLHERAICASKYHREGRVLFITDYLEKKRPR